MVFTRYERKLRTVSMWRIPSIRTISNFLATSGRTVPVSLFSSKFLGTISTRRAICSAVLCLGTNPNCSMRRNPRLLNLLRILVSRILSNSLPFVSSRLMVRNEFSPESFSGFRVEVTRACFHAGGKYCIPNLIYRLGLVFREPTISTQPLAPTM